MIRSSSVLSISNLLRKKAFMLKYASIVEHARNELKYAGLLDKNSDYDGMLGKSVLELCDTFAKQGHSGCSAGMTLDIFDKVARFDILTPLSSDKTQWMEVGTGVWQSIRKPSVFSKDGGGTWYDLDKKDDICQ